MDYGFDAGAGDGLMMGNQSVRSPGHTLAVRVKKKNMHNKSPSARPKIGGILSPNVFLYLFTN